MQVIYLPGFSSKNRAEMQSVSEFLTKKGIVVHQHEWPHWEDSTVEWSAEREVAIVEKLIKSLPEDDLAIVGKSLGTFVAIKLLALTNRSLEKLILNGIPYNDLSFTELKEYLAVLPNYQDQLTLIHNENDSHGEWKTVKGWLNDIKYELVLKPGDTHIYDYPEDVWKALSSNI